jgi:hypothetical protein
MVQAAFMVIDSDEAYYWLYAQHLQWGYFDHPPLVVLSIKLGETFGHGPFFTRLVTTILSGGTVYFGFKALPAALQQPPLYVLLFASIVLFHVYGFIATPDASLLFFTTLFFYAYRRYLEKENGANTVFVALSIAGLLYSKYHGVLPVFFTLLSNPRLVLKRSAWLSAGLAFILFVPHLWWQYQHNWVTVRYHLSERIASPYRISKTLKYIAGQLIAWGPFSTIPALVLFVTRRRAYSVYERAHLFTFWGVTLFFLLSSFRSTIELHWTLVAGPSFIVLLMGLLYHSTAALKRFFIRLSIITIVLLVIGRVLFIAPHSPVNRFKKFENLMFAKSWTGLLYQFARGAPVVFVDSYRFPALYKYYHPDAKVSGYNTVNYRRTQFNLYSDSALNNQPVYLARISRWSRNVNFFKTPYDTIFLQELTYRSVSSLQLTWLQPADVLQHAQPQTAVLLLCNLGKDTVQGANLSVNYTFLKTRNEQYTPLTSVQLPEHVLPPGCKIQIAVPVQLPEEHGTYNLVFSIVQPPLNGTFASQFYNVRVE